MNDIEKAIKYLRSSLNSIHGCVVDINRDNAFELAIQALQEKQERDNMRCENCKFYELEIIGNIFDNPELLEN